MDERPRKGGFKMSYIIYRKIGWESTAWYMVDRKNTQEEAVKVANRLFADWKLGVPNPPAHKVCYNGTTSVEVYRIDK
jgi:hypothetical protein